MNNAASTENWMLAFDASCCTCRSMSAVVHDNCDGKLSVVPLDRADVRELRQRVFGAEPPHTPTLLIVDGDGDGVRGYTGAQLAVRLTRRLGVRSGTRVVRAFGAATRAPEADSVDQAPASGLNRRAFVQLGAGAAVAAGLFVAGRKPAAFATPQMQQVKAWVARNRNNLPTAYDDVVRRPLMYRKAIYAELTPAQRSSLWATQLDRFAQQEAPLTAAQRSALAETRELLSRPQTHTWPGNGRSGPDEALARRASAAEQRMQAAFGAMATARAVGELGAAETQPTASAAPQPTANAAPQLNYMCACSQFSDFCSGYCASVVCSWDSPSNCGFGYMFKCDGVCQ